LQAALSDFEDIQVERTPQFRDFPARTSWREDRRVSKPNCGRFRSRQVPFSGTIRRLNPWRELMAADQFSEAALALLRVHFSGFSLNMAGDSPDSLPGHTVEETRSIYDELVKAGLMIAPHTQGQEQGARYWLTLAAVERKAEFLPPPTPSVKAPPEEAAAPAS
jgi:hypothetical protein